MYLYYRYPTLGMDHSIFDGGGGGCCGNFWVLDFFSLVADFARYFFGKTFPCMIFFSSKYPLTTPTIDYTCLSTSSVNSKLF